jgi:hypothetical protein
MAMTMATTRRRYLGLVFVYCAMSNNVELFIVS